MQCIPYRCTRPSIRSLIARPIGAGWESYRKAELLSWMGLSQLAERQTNMDAPAPRQVSCILLVIPGPGEYLQQLDPTPPFIFQCPSTGCPAGASASGEAKLAQSTHTHRKLLLCINTLQREFLGLRGAHNDHIAPIIWTNGQVLTVAEEALLAEAKCASGILAFASELALHGKSAILLHGTIKSMATAQYHCGGQ